MAVLGFKISELAERVDRCGTLHREIARRNLDYNSLMERFIKEAGNRVKSFVGLTYTVVVKPDFVVDYDPVLLKKHVPPSILEKCLRKQAKPSFVVRVNSEDRDV